ncbi:uncharacterized protein PV06_11644 [Exophiala oligosperma]|uniref:Uncharacterized protein n=1 Tax=Exophiala oligosperma TaxID=215243 RepID=A0A0D2DK35_9EURO|nr:uncharacterized protein PV06_11644 [Exophiala oligosperma]KIW36064.1 hypothetical protein PV06_11644 [Exophiala oligosperma]
MTPRLEKAVVADVDQVLHFCRLMIDREHFGTLWPKYKATTQYHCMVCKVQDTDSKMDFPILCEHLLHRDLVQAEKIQRITWLLDRVYDVLGSDNKIAKAVPFKVTPKGAKQDRQYQAILRYTGPDIETRLTLEQNHEHWLAHPQYFWEPVNHTAFGGLSPEAQIVSRYVSLRRSDV